MAVLGDAASGAAAGASFGPYGALAGAGLSILGGIFAGNQADEANAQAAAIQAQIMAEVDALQIPSIEKQRLVLERLESAGVLSPQLQQMIQSDETALASIVVSPEFEEAQLDSLGALQDISRGGGRTAQAERDLAEVEGDLKAKGAGVREGIIQEFEEKGQGGSTNQLLQMLLAEQGEQTERAEAGRDLSAEAEEKSLEAIIEAGRLGGDIRTQEFGEKTDIAKAEDEIERFNVGLERDITRDNINAQNQAAETNLNNQQQIMDQNVEFSNQENKHQVNLIKQHYDQELEKLRLKTGAMGDKAQQIAKAGADKAQQTGAAWNAGGKIIAAGAEAYDKRKKKV